MKDEEKIVLNPSEGEIVEILGKKFLRRIVGSGKRTELYPIGIEEEEPKQKKRK